MSIGERSSKRVIRVSGVLVASLLATLAFCGAAQAVTTESSITTPTPSSFAALETGENPNLQIAGTAAFSITDVDLRCYTSDGHETTLASDVPVSGGHFSATVPLALSFPVVACELRAIDTSDSSTNHGPAHTADPAQGVYLRLSRIREFTPHAGPLEYDVDDNGPAGLFQLKSAGGCALAASVPYDAAGEASYGLFECDGSLSEENFAGTRPSIRIDGADAYDAAAVSSIEGFSGPMPGQPQLTVSSSVDPATGAASVVESEPIVKCSPGGSFPPNAATDCTSFKSTGVTLETKWTTSHEGGLALQESRWLSSDGKSHSLDAIYQFGVAQISESGNPGSFRFPGDAGFSERAQGDTAALSAGPASYYFKRLHLLPDGGDGQTPLAGFTYTSAPDGPLRFLVGSESPSGEAQWEMPYQRTIPASGPLALGFGYSQGLSLGAVETLSHGAETALVPPTVREEPSTKPPPGARPRLILVGKPAARAKGVAMKLRCVGADGSCSARAKLTAGKTVYGAVAKKVATGRTVSLALPLNASGLKVVKRAGRKRLSLKVEQAGPGPVRKLFNGKLVVRAPTGHGR